MKANKFQQYQKRDVINAYLFLLPILLAVVVFILIPVIGTIWNSFFKDLIYSTLDREFIGFKNYGNVLKDESFWEALGFTMKFTLATVVLEAVLGVVFALILNESFKGRGMLRAVILIPWAVPTIVSAKIWQAIYDYSYGLLNWLSMKLGFITDKVDWLGTSDSAFWALVISDVWKTTPFVVIILLAGLQAIPQDVYKQAKIDGAKMLKRFFSITLPLIAPVLAIALIFRTIDAVRIFDLIYALTGGGPGGSTQTLSYLGYKAYLDGNFGEFSTISVLTFIVSFGITLVYVKLGNFGKQIK